MVSDDLNLLVPAIGQDSVQTRVEYRAPLEAPIVEGGPVAELIVTTPDMPEKRIPLVSDREVSRGGFLPRIRASTTVLFDKAMGQVQSLME